MKYFKYLGKLFSAGILAFLVLCIITSVYNLSPLRVENEYKNTDYVWEANSPWIKMTEGISYGLTDANGFNNQEVIENPDILLLGSSHTEGMNVTQDKNMCSILNDKFSGKYSVYNMGISGHTLYKVVQYLPVSLSVYEKVPKYVIIETSTTCLTKEEVDQAINAELEATKVNSDGLMAKLQKFPFLRQVYHQLDSGMMDMLFPADSVSAVSYSTIQDSTPVIDEQPYEDMFTYLKKVEEESGAQFIIMYHPYEVLEEDGSISFGFEEYTGVFSEYAEKYDIDFLDMTDGFEEMYREDNCVPHGFSTGAIGEGHINKYGHSVIAQSLYEYIVEIEEDE